MHLTKHVCTWGCGLQVEFATEAQAEAEQACAAANQRASELQAALGDAKSTSEQRQARLQHLEGNKPEKSLPHSAGIGSTQRQTLMFQALQLHDKSTSHVLPWHL